MIRSTARRLGTQSSSILASSTKTVFKRQTPLLKRFNSGHGHHDAEYPAESLFNKTSIFVTLFTAVTTGLVLNDRFNSKTGKSLVGDWLVPAANIEEVNKNLDDSTESEDIDRKLKLVARSAAFKPAFIETVTYNSVPEANPRSDYSNGLLTGETVSDRRQR